MPGSNFVSEELNFRSCVTVEGNIVKSEHNGKEVVELAGYTQRVANMFTVFDDCSHSRYMMSSRDL